MDIDKIKEEIFPDWSKAKRDMIKISFINNFTFAELNYGKRSYTGRSVRQKPDPLDAETGIRNALTSLKRCVKESNKMFKKYCWVPEKNTYYFTVYGTVGFACPTLEQTEISDVKFCRWTGSPWDYYLLGCGLVFKTERAARKYARSMEICGRQRKNILRRLP